MSEMILPGVYIEVRPEGLIVPGRVSVNNVGVVGTAGRGPVNAPTILSSYSQAREIFGGYDAWDEDNPDVLSLVRALELAFGHGATTVYAVRIAAGAARASHQLASASGTNVTLAAKTEGEWGNQVQVEVEAADAHSYVENEQHNGGAAITLNYHPIVESSRNRVTLFVDATQTTRALDLVYTGTPNPGQVQINTTSGALTFATGEDPAAADVLTAFYVVDQSVSAKVTLRYGTLEEVYIVASGNDLAADINDDSVLVDATPEANAAELPSVQLSGLGTNTAGENGAAVSPSDYRAGLDLLLNENVHIMVAAGQNHADMGADLTQHVTVASNDLNKRERIGIIGSGLADSFDDIRGHDLNSDRIVFVAPGIQANDAASDKRVTLPGAYTAAAIAGLMSSYDPHVSLTNKTVPVAGLQVTYNNGQLKELLQARVLALQDKLGFKVVRGITTSTNTAWQQITTRRIVDYAKFGVRSAADPYIGLLNNERVRGALRATINSFLAEMVEDEMLISYDLNVSATREQERQGICIVTMVIRPVFSIDFIKVTMFLE
jgi:hypothetical protein